MVVPQHYPSPLNMPEPPPPYSSAPSAPPQHNPAGATSSMGRLNADSEEGEEKFMPSTHFHHQQPPPPPPAPSAGIAAQGPIPPPPSHQIPVAHQHPYILPPGAVPHSHQPLPSFGPPPPPGYQPPNGFGGGAQIPQGQMLIGPPVVTTVTGQIPTPLPNNQGGQFKVIYAVPLGPHETQLECSNCKQPIRTKVLRRAGLLTWLICGALALVGCWPCCILPFCVQSCQDAEHFCPNCNAFIGKYSRI